MALPVQKRLKLASISKEKERTEQERVENWTRTINELVQENLIPGEKGEKGDTGLQGEMGPQGPMGPAGKDGINGVTEIVHKYEPLPEDVVKEEFIEELKREVEGLKRSQRFLGGVGGGAGDGVKYVSVTASAYKISRNELLDNGITIFGVNFAGPVTITVPQPKPGQIVYINDESGSADSNNITVTTLQS